MPATPALALWLTLALMACQRDRPAAPDGVLVVSKEQTASWVRNFNPLLSGGSVRWPTRNGIYEPLMIHTAAAGWVPWLATDKVWEDEGTSLRVTLRQDVSWSDGRPFRPTDVVTTFELLRDHAGLDTAGVWRHLASIEADGMQVVFRLPTPYVPVWADIAVQPIVPEHVFGALEDPLRFTNPAPVATGPFTEVRRFDTQVWELGKNPNYWQEGRPKVEALRFPALPSNDQANLALIRDEVDWAGNFVPAIDRIFVAPDPEHHHYWFPLTGGTVMLYPNHTVAPLEDVRVREAMSLAIDRELVVKVAMYDYSRPAHPSALSDSYADWRDPALTRGPTKVDFDPDRARRLLDDAGLVMGEEGWRTRPDGSPLTLTLDVVAGWSDWVRAGQVVSRSLRDVGLDVRLDNSDFGAWFERLQRGEYELAIAWSVEGPTPFNFYSALMAPSGVRPVGENAGTVWSRQGSPRMGALLDRFAATPDDAGQRAIAMDMQRVFVDEFPTIPLFPNPAWGACNSARFTGWPSADDPYAPLSPNPEPAPLLVLTRLEPR